MKAKFICKYHGTGYERNFIYMDYEYRGHTYTVYENLGKGNEPLAWQHRNEQDRIDKLIELRNNNSNEDPFNIDEIWEMMGWDE